jgi:hypothetical protein
MVRLLFMAQLIAEKLTVLVSVVRVRSREGRRNRAPPPRVRWKDGKKVNPAVEDAKAAAKA